MRLVSKFFRILLRICSLFVSTALRLSTTTVLPAIKRPSDHGSKASSTTTRSVACTSAGWIERVQTRSVGFRTNGPEPLPSSRSSPSGRARPLSAWKVIPVPSPLTVGVNGVRYLPAWDLVRTDPVASELLLAAILTDTVNLDASKGRCLTQDQEAADRLLRLLGLAQAEVFQRVQGAKFDVGHLTSAQLLRKVRSLGLCTRLGPTCCCAGLQAA